LHALALGKIKNFQYLPQGFSFYQVQIAVLKKQTLYTDVWARGIAVMHWPLASHG
jgi:hypothetical protein